VSGKPRAGLRCVIHTVGFSGIADITLVDALPAKTNGKLDAGKQLLGMSDKLRNIAKKEI
jgi:hypothetical protein